MTAKPCAALHTEAAAMGQCRPTRRSLAATAHRQSLQAAGAECSVVGGGGRPAGPAPAAADPGPASAAAQPKPEPGEAAAAEGAPAKRPKVHGCPMAQVAAGAALALAIIKRQEQRCRHRASRSRWARPACMLHQQLLVLPWLLPVMNLVGGCACGSVTIAGLVPHAAAWHPAPPRAEATVTGSVSGWSDRVGVPQGVAVGWLR